jgi:hypothetical protein
MCKEWRSELEARQGDCGVAPPQCVRSGGVSWKHGKETAASPHRFLLTGHC